MFCIYCGAKLRDGAKFCTACGKPVNTSVEAKDAEDKESKDLDIKAPAQAGEIRCIAGAAQSAFLKLLKKSLMALVIFLSLPLSLGAQSGTSNKLGPFSLKWADDLTVSYTIEFEGASASNSIFRGDRQYLSEDGKLAKDDINGYFSKDYVTVRVKASPMALSGDYKDLGYVITANYGKWGSASGKEKQTTGWKPLSQGIDAEFKIPAVDKESLMDLRIAISLKFDGYISWSNRSHDFFLAYRESHDKTINTSAGSESGENSWVVPAAVLGGLVIGGIALKNRKKKKSAAKSQKKEPQKEEKKKEEEKEDKDDDDEEKATYEMRICKDFGDKLTPGASPEKVYARIVRISADGKEATDKALTAKISISGDDYLEVKEEGLAGEYASASVAAPERGTVPEEAVVNFRLAGAGGAFTNRMHFRIARAGIIFFQENITLPACSDEVWRLPFAVQGASAAVAVEACGSCLEAYDITIEPGEKECLYYAVIKERAKDKKGPGTWEYYNLGVRVKSGDMEKSDSLPLYRFHMGLSFKPHSTIPCYLATNSTTGKIEVPHAYADLVYFDWDPNTNDIVTIYPVPTDFKIAASNEREQGFLDKLGIKCEVTSTKTDNGRSLEIYPVKGVLDPPTRFNATITLTADCGKGRVETVTKTVLMASQPVRQNATLETYEEDRRIGEGLLNIQRSIWDNGEYSRLFPLYKLIDVMVDGYDGAYGYDKDQVATVKDVYKRFLNGDLAGANATAKRVTLADEMAMFVDCFLQSSEEVENSMGFFTRMAVGVATLGMSDAVFTGLQVARDMKAAAEKGGDTYDVFVAGVKVVAWEYAMSNIMDYGTGKLKEAAKKYAPDQLNAASKSISEAKQKASDFFSSATGRKTGGVLQESKSIKSNVSKQADDAVDAFRKNKNLSKLDESLDQVYKNGQAHGKAKVEDLQAAQWLMETNPTPENVKLYKKKVLEVQRDKFAMHELNNLPDGNAARATFNNELDNVYKGVDAEVRESLKRKGYKMADDPFSATSSNKADLKAGNKVTMDRDVTYKTVDGLDVPQKVAQEEYEKAFYKRTTGIDAPNQKVASEWAQMHDQSVVQKGSNISYGDDLNPVIKDWDAKLSDARRTGDVMTYKSTEWFEQTDQMIRKANELPDSGMRLDMLEQALSKRQEATRQMVKQFKYVDGRDIAAQTKGSLSQISDKMRWGMEVSSRLFAKGSDALTLVEVEKILAQKDLTLELLSLQLGETLKIIG